jgi:hypothetical protein
VLSLGAALADSDGVAGELLAAVVDDEEEDPHAASTRDTPRRAANGEIFDLIIDITLQLR